MFFLRKVQHHSSREMDPKLTGRRCQKGKSDSISRECSCPDDSGQILLFYNFIQINPHQLQKTIVEFLKQQPLSGKIRLSNEGYNITVAGSKKCISDFEELFLSSAELIPENERIPDLNIFKSIFFKPADGCIHCFDSISIKIVDQLCPFDGVQRNRPVTSTQIINRLINEANATTEPLNNSKPSTEMIISMPPAKFHNELLKNSDNIVLDLRNHYESKIGHFESAICPPIRKFSSFPKWIIGQLQKLPTTDKIFTYCTGGVRCDQAAQYISEVSKRQVILLEGGIHNYMSWAEETKSKSLFKGSNYVFDARQSVGDDVISNCLKCGTPTRRMKKCLGTGCHLNLVCCDSCKSIYCCFGCEEMEDDLSGFIAKSTPGVPRLKRTICDCEKERRFRLNEV